MSIKLGVYQHYNGRHYQVIGIARHSETLEEMIVYQALYDNYGLWVRPRTMFEELITLGGKTRKRFEYLMPCLSEPPKLR
jgi:hypothetical protein